MIKILELLLALIIIVYLSRLISALLKRVNLSKAVKRLSKIEGVKIFELKNTYLSLLKPSAEAEYYLSVYGDEYLVRVYNGGGSSYAVHFASERFTVKFPRAKSVVFMPNHPRARRPIILKGFNFGGSVKTLEPIQPPEFMREKEYTEVIVFNPAPSDVSYVSPEKTKIKIAFTGDEVYGRRIFTASTFEIFVDREARRKKHEKTEKER